MMFLTTPSFIILEPKQKKFRALVVADSYEKEEIIKKYDDLYYLKSFGNVSKFYSFRKSVSSYMTSNINEKLRENLQSLAFSRHKPLSLEVEGIKLSNKEKVFDKLTSPYYKIGLVRSLSVVSNVKMPKIVKKVYYDYDLKAKDAITYLYYKGKDVYDIEPLLSTASFGLLRNRRLVPTKWSITAIDDTLAKYLYQDIRFYEIGEDVKLFVHESYHNLFYILAIPSFWSYELIEKVKNSSGFMRDYEFLQPRKDYAFNTTGGYYAIRLPLLEYCRNEGKQYAFFVLRVISPQYYRSVGVWVLREAVRDALKNKPLIFKNVKDAINYLNHKTSSQFLDIFNSSLLLKRIKNQKTLFSYA